VEKALDEYYSYLGWDVETGLPSPEALRGLELAFLLKDE
jgi:aldehyde:ferredoxin oxidoreductase